MTEVYNNRSATLILKTSDGVANVTKQSTVWTGVDMRRVLGDMYDKFKSFNLVLLNVIQPAGATISAGNDQMPLIYLSGLNFRNQNYQPSTNSISSLGYVGSFVTTNNTVNTVFTCQNAPILTFSTIDNVNITIQFNTITGAIPASTYPNYVYVFQIFGVLDKV